MHVSALCRKSDMARERQMMECLQRVGCPLDVIMFSVVVGSYVSLEDMDDAREVAQDMIRRCLRWDSLALVELIGMLLVGSVGAQAQELLLESLFERYRVALGQLIGA
ncbi:hypothetical protein ABZP36_000516 [Zizania latifolia]